MKSITPMFFESRPRISIYLNGGDHAERAGNSVIRQVVLCRALQLMQVLLVPNLRRSAPLAPLRSVLFGSVAIVLDEERVHLRPHSNELGHRLAARLVVEFANRFLVRGVEVWTRIVE